jgi:hypothetical protein
MRINILFMDQHGTRKETNQEMLGEITTLQDDIEIEKQPMGPKV